MSDLDASIDAARWSTPFTADEVRAIERALGHAVPEPTRTLWRHHGSAEVGRASFYDASLVLDVLDQYTEAALRGLLPLASDGGSGDYALDAADTLGCGCGAVLLVDRGVMTYASARLVAPDLVAFLSWARDDHADERPPTMAERWTTTERERAYDRLPAPLVGLRREDLEIQRLHFRTWTPASFVLRRDAEIGGVPCAASVIEVQLDADARVVLAVLSRDHRLGAFVCKAGTTVVLDPAGAPHRFTPTADVLVDGLRWKGGSELTLADAQLPMMWGVLAVPAEIAGIPCAASAVRLRVAPERRVEEATLGAPCRVGGVDLPAGAWFELVEESLSQVCLPTAARIGERDVPAGVRTYVR